MKSFLLNKTILKLSGIYEIHSIPGRLRVRIPGLKYVKDIIEEGDIQDIFQNYRLKGVKSLDVNFLTSKALIIYDESETNKDHILTFMNRLREKVFELFPGDKKISGDAADLIFKGLKEEGYEFEEE